MEEHNVEVALEEVRPFLQADGFDLRLEELGASGDVVVCLEATAEACLDCLVSDDMLIEIIGASIRRHAPEVGEVSLVKRGFDDVTH